VKGRSFLRRRVGIFWTEKPERAMELHEERDVLGCRERNSGGA